VYDFEVVNNFIYLGTEITSDNITSEVKRRIRLANRCEYGLSKLIRSKLLYRKTKLKLYNCTNCISVVRKLGTRQRMKENISATMDFERKEDLAPDRVTSYHMILEQLSSPTVERQQITVKYGRQILIKRNLIEDSSSLEILSVLCEFKILKLKCLQSICFLA
uniref:Uncharacterized protein n=1 Tax=Megaselia scalaris TaxID=36166 RepID=T1GSX2_MEGSC